MSGGKTQHRATDSPDSNLFEVRDRYHTSLDRGSS